MSCDTRCQRDVDTRKINIDKIPLQLPSKVVFPILTPCISRSNIQMPTRCVRVFIDYSPCQLFGVLYSTLFVLTLEAIYPRGVSSKFWQCFSHVNFLPVPAAMMLFRLNLYPAVCKIQRYSSSTEDDTKTSTYMFTSGLPQVFSHQRHSIVSGNCHIRGLSNFWLESVPTGYVRAQGRAGSEVLC